MGGTSLQVSRRPRAAGGFPQGERDEGHFAVLGGWREEFIEASAQGHCTCCPRHSFFGGHREACHQTEQVNTITIEPLTDLLEVTPVFRSSEPLVSAPAGGLLP